MDGTLIDSEPYWIAAETELLAGCGVTWSHEQALQLVGKGLWHSAEVLRQAGASTYSADEIVYGLTAAVRTKLHDQGLPWRPGARELLLEMREAGLPTALVTMSLRSMADEVASQVGFDGFDVIVAGDQVTYPKPHPEPYLIALDALKIDAAHAIGIEDSLAGLASAVGAGLLALGVPHMIDLSESAAQVIWPTLLDRNLSDLRTLLSELRQ